MSIMEGYTSDSTLRRSSSERNKIVARRFSFNLSSESETSRGTEDHIQVFARVKPSTTDVKFEISDALNCIKHRTVELKSDLQPVRTTSYKFDHIFTSNSTQAEVFNKMVRNRVKYFLNGQNSLLFSYGATSSGKTYSIQGRGFSPGIIPRTLFLIFKSLCFHLENNIEKCPNKSISVSAFSDDDKRNHYECKNTILSSYNSITSSQAHGDSELDKSLVDVPIDDMTDSFNSEMDAIDLIPSGCGFSLWVSFAEVYGESIFDLLDPNERKPLKIGIDSDKSTYIKGLKYILVNSWLEAWQCFIYGRNKLHIESTRLNYASSRSHCIFTVKLVARHSTMSKCSQFSICDLAGSERQKKVTNNDKEDRALLKQSSNINNSLMILHRCLDTLRRNQETKDSRRKKIVPFRDSKITQIFQSAFSRNESIQMLVNINPSKELEEETLQTLKVSAVAKDVIVTHKIRQFRPKNIRLSEFCDAPKEISAEQFFFNKGANQSEKSGEQKVDSDTLTLIEELREDVKLKNKKILMLEKEINELKCIKNQPLSDCAESKKFHLLAPDSDKGRDQLLVEYSKLYHALEAQRKLNNDLISQNETLTEHINKLSYLISIKDSNVVVKELIEDLKESDTKNALLKMHDVKLVMEKKLKLYSQLVECAREEMNNLQDKIQEADNTIVQKDLQYDLLESKYEELEEAFNVNQGRLLVLETDCENVKQQLQQKEQELEEFKKTFKQIEEDSKGILTGKADSRSMKRKTRETIKSESHSKPRRNAPRIKSQEPHYAEILSSDEDFVPEIKFHHSVKRSNRKAKKKDLPEYVTDLLSVDYQAKKEIEENLTLEEYPTSVSVTSIPKPKKKLFQHHESDDDDDDNIILKEFEDMKLNSPKHSPRKELRRHYK